VHASWPNEENQESKSNKVIMDQRKKTR